jgi:hypothetical protein
MIHSWNTFIHNPTSPLPRQSKSLLLPPCTSNNKLDLILNATDGRESVVNIATRYRLDGSGFEPWWGQEIVSSHPSRLTPQLTEPSVKRSAGLFPRVKWPRRGVDHPPSSRTEVKEGVKLYLYSPSVFKAFHRETLYLSFYQISQLSQYTAAVCSFRVYSSRPQSHSTNFMLPHTKPVKQSHIEKFVVK